MSTRNQTIQIISSGVLEFIEVNKAVKNESPPANNFKLTFKYQKQMGGSVQLAVSLEIQHQILVQMEFINTKDRIKTKFDKLVRNCQKYNDEYCNSSQMLIANSIGNVEMKFTSEIDDFNERKIKIQQIFCEMEKMIINFIFYSPPKEVPENKFQYLKYLFELRRRKRQKSTQMGVHLYEKNLQCDSIDQLNKYKVEGKLKNQDRISFKKMFLQKIGEEFEEVQKKILQNIKNEEQNNYKIVRQIVILKQKINKKELFVNMGLISLCDCQFIIKEQNMQTMVDESSFMMDEKQEEKLINAQLVIKTINPKEKEDSIKSFQNEKLVLDRMKRFSCKRIASYYTQNLEKIKNSNNICSKFYPKSFQEEKDYLKIAKQLAQALYFFNFMKILHRDLKDSNIKVDEEGNLKIIDFGSAVPNINDPNVKDFDLEMRSTAKYQLLYNDLPTIVKKLYSQEIYERHELFDLYSYGKILEKCISKMEEENALKEGLKYISKKSMESNPEDRLSPIQILGFLEFFPFKN